MRIITFNLLSSHIIINTLIVSDIIVLLHNLHSIGILMLLRTMIQVRMQTKIAKIWFQAFTARLWFSLRNIETFMMHWEFYVVAHCKRYWLGFWLIFLHFIVKSYITTVSNTLQFTFLCSFVIIFRGQFFLLVSLISLQISLYIIRQSNWLCCQWSWLKVLGQLLKLIV